MRLLRLSLLLVAMIPLFNAAFVSADNVPILGTIPTDYIMKSIALLRGSNRAYGIVDEGGYLYVFDLDNYSVKQKVALQGQTRGMAINTVDKNILITTSRNVNSGYLYVATPNNTIAKIIAIAGDPQGIAVNPENNTAVMALEKNQKLLQISTDSYSVMKQISLPYCPESVSIDTKTNTAVVVAAKPNGQGIHNVILLVDINKGKIAFTISLKYEVTAVDIDQEKDIAMAVSAAGIHIIDIMTGRVSSQINETNVFGAGINQSTHTAIVSNGTGITMLDPDTNAINQYQIQGVLNPGVISVDRYRNVCLMAAQTASAQSEVVVVQLPNPVPEVSNLVPKIATAGNSGFTLTVEGRKFIATSSIQFNQNDLMTSFIDNNTLSTSVPPSLIAIPGIALVTVTNPPPEGGTSDPFSFTINCPIPTSLTINPVTAMISAGGRQSYTVTGVDADGNNIDVSGTTFSISPDGTCAGSTCSATMAGVHTVTAYNSGIRATASLAVRPGPLTTLTIGPSSTSTIAGGNQSYTATGIDAYGNSIGDITSATTFSISPDGTCTGSTCSATMAGLHTISGNNGGIIATADLTVTAATLSAITPNTIVAGGPDFTLRAYGSNFVSGYVINFNGQDLVTTYVNSEELDATVPSSLIAAGGTYSVVVINPYRVSSNAVNFNVSNPIPPDPVTVAPSLDPTAANTMLSSTQFLYTGSNPIQTGVAPGTIDVKFAAVIRGRVLKADGSALPGVNITILNHPDFGSTLSRSDGAFDMAVNGGAILTVDYAKPGYLPVQKQVNVPWQDYVVAPDAILTVQDSAATRIDLTSNAAIQTVRGNIVADDSGTRQATLLFSQGTTATMVMPDGTTHPISSLTVRATEFTVGANGPAAMPGPLPPNVAYTYAVDYSADEAIAVGAKTVQFSKPVISYTDNFLHFYVGTVVPSAYYDRDQGVWVPSDNGLVISILSIANGTAVLDVDGNGTQATSQEFVELGITASELQQLAALYQPGQSFWRVPINHFTYFDFNWGRDSAGATTPNQANPQRTAQNVARPYCRVGCVIETQNQTLGETLNITGAPFSLNYRSSLQRGRIDDYGLNIPLSGAAPPPGLKRIDLEIDVAGQTIRQSFGPGANQSYSFTWNGLDVYGRRVQGGQPITTKIGYVYDAVYLKPSENPQIVMGGNYDRLFGHCSYYGEPATSDRTRQEFTLWQINQNTTSSPSAMGHWNAQAQGFGGWTPAIQQAYDPAGRVLYLGSGSRKIITGISNIISTIVGNGQVSSLSSPAGVAVDGKGNVYIADKNNNVIKKVDTSGNVSVIAGTGIAGFSGDGGPASQAALNRPSGVSIDTPGNIYIADKLNNRIRKISSSGIISTIAGNGLTGYSGDGGPATQAALYSPSATAIDSTGNIYIADTGNNAVRQIDPAGVIVTVAGVGSPGFSGDYGRAPQAKLNSPAGVSVDISGNLYIADANNNRIRKVAPTGIITTIAGNGLLCNTSWGIGCDNGDGGAALKAYLNGPSGVAVDASGNIFIADMYYSRIRKVDSTGMITTVAGNGTPEYGGDNGTASQAGLNFPAAVAVDPTGNLYVADTGNNCVRSIKSALPGVSTQDILIPSEDGGEVYIFDASGRHLSTQDTLTQAVIYSFSYDSNRRLLAVTDREGNVTTIGRDGLGNIVSIMAPGGQMTTFGLDSNGYLASATDPGGNTYSFTYTSSGLMISEKDPKGNSHNYNYDSQGRLTLEQDPAGGSQVFSRTGTPAGYTVSLTTGMGLTSTYKVDTTPLGTVAMTNIDPAGAQTVTTEDIYGTGTTSYPDGTIVNKVMGPDPRFGMQSPVTTGMNIKTPGELQLSATGTRTATLSDPRNLMSLTSLTDILSVNGKTFISTYNASTETITNTTPMGRQSITTLNSQGKVVSEQVAGLLPVNYVYDSQGRLNTITQGSGPASRVYSIDYDSQNRISSITDPLSRSMSFAYDAAGRVMRETLPDGRVINYSYDANGNVTLVTPPGRPAHGFDYTSVDLLQDYEPPSVGAGDHQTSYTYNVDKRLTLITRPAGSPAGGIGQNQKISFTYDGSLLMGSSWTGDITGSVGFVYNNDFKITSESVNGDNLISFTYDDDGLLTEAGGLVIARDAGNGLVTGSTLGNVSDSWTYNGFGETASYSASYNASSLLNIQYTHDNLGRISQKTETISGVTSTYVYTYDQAGRLTDVAMNGSNIDHYVYDLNGNRISYTNGTTTLSGTYDDQDRLIQYGANAYGYTDNGELQSKVTSGGATTYSYDAFDNMKSVQLTDGTAIEYIVDGKNRRVGRRVNGVLVQGFLYEDQLRPIVELDGSGNIVSRFIYGTKVNVPDYMIKDGATYRIISDALGSPRLVVDVSSGTVIQRMDYDEFGNLINDSNPGFQPFGFAGGLYDKETGLIRFGARDYDAETGRWTAKDPILFNGGDTNLFGYVENDPVNWIDPWGLFHYNAPPPRTVPVQGKTLKALECVEQCLQNATNNRKLNLLITGGAEKTGHSRHSHHSRGEACDIHGSNPVKNDDVMSCAAQCRFGAGQWESFPNNPNRNHWHLQLTPGNGVPALPAP